MRIFYYINNKWMEVGIGVTCCIPCLEWSSLLGVGLPVAPTLFIWKARAFLVQNVQQWESYCKKHENNHLQSIKTCQRIKEAGSSSSLNLRIIYQKTKRGMLATPAPVSLASALLPAQGRRWCTFLSLQFFLYTISL